MAQISLLARAMGGVTVHSESLQACRDQTTNGSQGGSEFILVPTTQEQGARFAKLGEILAEGISCKQMHAMGECCAGRRTGLDFSLRAAHQRIVSEGPKFVDGSVDNLQHQQLFGALRIAWVS